jgi:hypothetical protein
MAYIIEFDSEPYEMEANDDDDAIRVAKQFAGQVLQEVHEGRTSFRITLWGADDALLYHINIETQHYTGSKIRRTTGS